MAAFFFPEDVPAIINPMEGFIAYSSGERKFYRRQHVSPLDFAALLADAKAKPSFLVVKENHKGIPEKNFCRYYREDGSDFIAGTKNTSPFTYPGREAFYRSLYVHSQPRV
jgi:hypothetical protein